MFLSPISLAVNRPGRRQTLEQQIAALFSAGEQGAWYDPSGNNTTWRRNRLTYTQEFDNAAWTKNNLDTDGTPPWVDQAVAPDGTTTGDKLIADSTNTTHFLSRAIDVGGLRVFSVYLKAGEYTNAELYDVNSDRGFRVDLTTGDISPLTVLTKAYPQIYSAVAVGSWYRVTIGHNVGSTINNPLRIYLVNQSSATSFAGNNSDGLFVWGAQIDENTTVATAYQRIITPEITYLSTVQAQPLLFQDSAGTLPVTEVEQPVGLMLDRRKGLALGSELVTNGDFSNGTTGFTAVNSNVSGSSVISGEFNVVASASGSGGFTQDLTVVQGRTYKVQVTARRIAGSGSVRFQIYDGAAFTTLILQVFDITTTAAAVTYTVYVRTASTTTMRLYLYADTSTTGGFDNVTVKLLDGNHAYQTTSSARPHLRSRYNLLTYSEQFDNGINGPTSVTISANSSLAPDGTNTADTITETTDNTPHFIGQNVSVVSGTVYTQSIYCKAGTASVMQLAFGSGTFGSNAYANFTLTGAGIPGSVGSSATSSITSIGNGWYRCSITATATSSASGFGLIVALCNGNSSAGRVSAYSGSTSNNMYIWGAQLNLGSTAMSYQRIAATPTLSQPPTYATTSTMGGEVFRPYLFFDGADLMKTASIDISSTNKATCWVGVMSYTTASGTFLSHGPNLETTDGTFEVRRTSGSPGPYSILARGNVFYGGFNTAAKTAYSKDVISVRYDLSATPNSNAVIPRVNGVLDQTQGTGGTLGSINWTAQEFAIGARSGGTLYHNGDWYGCIFRAAASSLAEVETGERWVASKAGVTL